MSTKEARKAASAKWDKENMTILGCRVTKKKAAEFKEACSTLGLVPNQVLLTAVNEAIDRIKKEE